MTIPVQPVIMAGGSGTRLWPLSRAAYPKQFLVLSGASSLFQQAAARLDALGDNTLQVRAAIVVGNEEHRYLMLDQLQGQPTQPAAVLLEPMGRNTAPAMTLAALQALAKGDDPVLVVTPADQTVSDEAAFTTAVRRAVQAAAGGAVAILGVPPDRPETGYGYIQSAVASDGGERTVSAFKEKPDLATAQSYLDAGGYDWNAGMFVLRASRWMEALARFRPDIEAACRAAFASCSADGLFRRPARDAFAAVPAESVDYAVMERCPGSGIDIRMVPLDAGWNDLGAWAAVWQVGAKDAHGNLAQGDTIVRDSTNTLVHATSRLVTAVGLTDLVVVETPDAVLVADRKRSEEVKQIVGALSQHQRAERTLHRKVHRPWGWYDSIDSGPGFQVKRIAVKPGQRLSLQKHHHRAEHWVVVRGEAEVTNGEQVMRLQVNQSTYIPVGQIHRLANPGTEMLEIIEVQSGGYLGEDDIVRFDDNYGRTT